MESQKKYMTPKAAKYRNDSTDEQSTNPTPADAASNEQLVGKLYQLTEHIKDQRAFVNELTRELNKSTLPDGNIKRVPGLIANWMDWSESADVGGASEKHFTAGGYTFLAKMILMMAQERLRYLERELARWSVIDPNNIPDEY